MYICVHTYIHTGQGASTAGGYKRKISDAAPKLELERCVLSRLLLDLASGITAQKSSQ